MRPLFLIGPLLLVVAAPAFGQQKQVDEYLKLSAHARGVLKISIDEKTGKRGTARLTFSKFTGMVIGLTEPSIRLELPADNKDLEAMARELNGKNVIVTGTFVIIPPAGTAIRPVSYAIVVESFQSAEKE